MDIKQKIEAVESGVPASEVVETVGIKAMYRKAGMKPPKGRGIHTVKFHKTVTAIGAGQKKRREQGKAVKPVNPYAVAMAQLGAKKAVKKSHRRSE